MSIVPPAVLGAFSRVHRIVIIDDEPLVTRVIATFLRAQAFHPEVAFSGADGLRLVNEVSPAMVICDMRMPGMGGDEVFQTLRAQSHTQHIPVLIVSAYPKEQCGDVGDAYLQKPFQLAEMIKLVRQLIGGASSTASSA